MTDRRVLSYNPHTGMTTYHAEEDGKQIISYEQDVSGALELAKALRNDEEYSKRGIKQELWHVATIPDSILMKVWVEEKCNPYTREGTKRLANIIHSKYPAFKVTTKKHCPKI